MRMIVIIWPLLLIWACKTTGEQTASSKPNQKLELYSIIESGDSALSEGDLVGAEKHYLQATRLTDELIASNSSHRISIFPATIFDPYDRLGNLYLITNNLAKSEHYFETSREKRDKALPQRSIFRIPPIVGLGELYLKKGEIVRASRYFNKAQKMLHASTTSFYNDKNISKTILYHKFESELSSGDYKSAGKTLERLSVGGLMKDPSVPKVMEFKARYSLYIDEYTRCRDYIEKAKLFASTNKNTLNYFQIIKTEALMEWKQKNIHKAFDLLNNLISAYKDYVKSNFSAMSEHEREAFYNTIKNDFDLFNSFVVSNIGNDTGSYFRETVYNNQLFGKGLLLNEINKIKNQIYRSDDKELQHILGKWEKAKSELSSLYFNKNKSNEIEIVEAEISSLERQINEKTRLIKSIDKDFDWREIQGTLNEGEAAVEIIRINQFELDDTDQKGRFDFSGVINYMVLFIDKNSKHPKSFIISNGNELEQRFLNYYRNAVFHKLRDQHSYNNYWRPFKNHLAEYRRIYLSSDGVYNQINLNTLKNPETNRYLLDEIDLIFVTNTKDLIKHKFEGYNKRKSIYLFGRPAYELNEEVLVKKPDLNNTRLRSIKSEALMGFKEQSFADLPATQDEIISISQLVSKVGWRASTFVGANATETQIKESSQPHVLHIATHGFFLQSDQALGGHAMVRSGIILAGVNNELTSQTDDGILTAYEATNLMLDSTYLVVLSACETGVGAVKNGEGVYGLQRGFTVAGARYILMSLWKVDDYSTGFLMKKFYEYWMQYDDLHIALKMAQTDLRKQFDHPFYWGGFVLLGN